MFNIQDLMAKFQDPAALEVMAKQLAGTQPVPTATQMQPPIPQFQFSPMVNKSQPVGQRVSMNPAMIGQGRGAMAMPPMSPEQIPTGNDPITAAFNEPIAVPPGSPEEAATRQTGWKEALGKMLEDPDMRMALFTTGLKMMQPVQPGQSGLGHAAQATLSGTDYLMNLKQQKRKTAREDKLDSLAERETGVKERGVGVQEAAQQDAAKQTDSEIQKNVSLANYYDRMPTDPAGRADAKSKYALLRGRALAAQNPDAYKGQQIIEGVPAGAIIDGQNELTNYEAQIAAGYVKGATILPDDEEAFSAGATGKTLAGQVTKSTQGHNKPAAPKPGEPNATWQGLDETKQAEALKRLKANPSAKEAFKTRFGFVPAGY